MTRVPASLARAPHARAPRAAAAPAAAAPADAPSVAAALAASSAVPSADASRSVRRPRLVRRHLLLAAGVAVAAWLLAPSVDEVPRAVSALGSASPLWLALAAVAAAGVYAAQALALQSASPRRLPVRRNLQVQVASTAATAMTPAGVGGLALHARFLERGGVPRAEAVASVGVGRLTAAVVHVTTLALLAPLVTSRLLSLELPAAVLAGALGVVAGLAALAVTVPQLRRRAAQALAPLVGVARRIAVDPRRVGGLLGGSFLVSAFRALTFAAALRALGGSAPLVAVAAVFLAAEAAGALGSTPGGLGVLDGVALSGTMALGVPAAAGVAAVLVFRLLTLWLPAVPGLLTLRSLRQASVL